MAIEQKSITLDGKEFVLQTLPATRGIEAAVTISHIMAGAADGIGDMTIGFYDIDINIGKLVAGMFKRLSVSDTPNFIKKLVIESVISPEITVDNYEIYFSGNYETLCDLVIAILEHNKFIDLVKKKVSAIMEQLSESGMMGQESTQ